MAGERTVTNAESGRRERKMERMDVRIAPSAKRAIERAAALSGRTLSAFVVEASYREARRIVTDESRMVLSGRDRKVFLDAILDPPKPSPALRKAISRHRRLVG